MGYNVWIILEEAVLRKADIFLREPSIGQPLRAFAGEQLRTLLGLLLQAPCGCGNRKRSALLGTRGGNGAMWECRWGPSIFLLSLLAWVLALRVA